MLLPILLAFLTPALATLLERSSPAPLIKAYKGHLIERSYIVRLRNDTETAAVGDIISSIGAQPDYVYSHSFQGFAAYLTKEQVKTLRDHPSVEYIEQDTVITTQDIDYQDPEDQVENEDAEPHNEEPHDEEPHDEEPHDEEPYDEESHDEPHDAETEVIEASDNKISDGGQAQESELEDVQPQCFKIVPAPTGGWTIKWALFPWRTKPKKIATQRWAPWNLVRLSHRKRRHSTYKYDKSAGTGSCVYVIDTGIDIRHPRLQCRAQFLKNFAGGKNTDENGHGTSVAGIIGSTKYGVAKNTTMFAVKVVGQNGTAKASTIVAGMEWVMKDAPRRDCPKGIVVNISLGVSDSKTLTLTTNLMVDSGLFVAVAAGNQGTNAVEYALGAARNACTVGATDKKDVFAPYSNYGKMVDVLAPGTFIKSIWSGGGTKINSGTSMASAHVAGLGAYLLGMNKTTNGLCDYIVSTALRDVVDMRNHPSSNTPNLLINNGVKDTKEIYL